MSARKLVLLRLVALDEPLQKIQADLATFPWDSEDELVILLPVHVASLLKRYLAGRLGADELEAWASTVEGRDDIGFQPRQEQLLSELVHELANPLLTCPMTHLRATLLLGRVESLAP